MVYTLPAPANPPQDLGAVIPAKSYKEKEAVQTDEKPKSFLDVMTARLQAFQMTPEQLAALKEQAQSKGVAGDAVTQLLQGIDGVQLSLKDIVAGLKELAGFLQKLEARGDITLSDDVLGDLKALQGLYVIGQKDELFAEGFDLAAVDLKQVFNQVQEALSEADIDLSTIDVPEKVKAFFPDNTAGEEITPETLSAITERIFTVVEAAVAKTKPAPKSDPLLFTFNDIPLEESAGFALQQRRADRIAESLKAIDANNLPPVLSEALIAAQGGSKKAILELGALLKNAIGKGGGLNGQTFDMDFTGQVFGQRGERLPSELLALVGTLEAEGLLSSGQPRASSFHAALQQAVNQGRGSNTPHTAAEQVAVKVRKAAAENAHKINVKLRPANLGSVSVEMSINAQGAVTAKVTAERLETLDLLRNDAKQLTDALKAAGLEADQGMMEFSLSSQSDQQQAFLREARNKLGKVKDGTRPFADAFAAESENIHQKYIETHRGMMKIWV